MRPLISYEYSLKDAAKAHVEVINHKRAGCGRIIMNPDLLYVCDNNQPSYCTVIKPFYSSVGEV